MFLGMGSSTASALKGTALLAGSFLLLADIGVRPEKIEMVFRWAVASTLGIYAVMLNVPQTPEYIVAVSLAVLLGMFMLGMAAKVVFTVMNRDGRQISG